MPPKKATASAPGLFDIGAQHSLREVVNEARAAELLSRATVDWDEVVHVRLSGKSLTLDGAQHICTHGLGRVPSGRIEHADLSDVIASRPEQEAKLVLACLAEALVPHGPTIHTLDLSDNALGLKGIDAIAPLILASRRTLQHLQINNNGLEQRAALQISVLMTGGDADGVGAATTVLRRFHTFNNLLESAGARELSHLLRLSPDLTDLRFSSTRVGAEGAQHIADAIVQSGAQLHRLDLADNSLLPEGIAHVAKALRSQSSLTHLNLGATAAGDEGVEAICSALLESRAPISHLDLSCNEITAEGSVPLAKLIVSLSETLVELKLAENELGSEGAARLADAIRECTRLQLLDLSVNEIAQSGACRMAGKLPESLERLELNGNLISADGLTALTDSLPAGCVLGDMDMNDEDYDEEEEAESDGDADEPEAEDDSAIDAVAAQMDHVHVS